MKIELISVLKNCHASENNEITDQLSGVICLAKNLADSWGFADGIESAVPVGMKKLFSLLNISERDMEEWTPQLRENVDLVIQAQGE